MVASVSVKVELANPISSTAKISADIATRKIEELERGAAAHGTKVLPLSIFRCSLRRRGAIVFHVVEFQTSYDFTKVGRLQVDSESSQEVVDDGPLSGELLYVVPVILQPLASEKMKLVFSYVFKERHPFANWVFINSRGENTTLIALGEEGASSGIGQGSLIAFPGGPDHVQAQYLATKARADPRNSLICETLFRLQSEMGPPLSNESALPSANAPFGVLSELGDVWNEMTLKMRVGLMSFGRSLRDVAVRCAFAVAQLNAAARQTAWVGLSASAEGYVLACALRFAPCPTGRRDRPLGMMFDASLAQRADIWEVFAKALPGWGVAGRPKLAPARWTSLLEPLPSTWAQLDAALAALLEQRFLNLVSAVQHNVAHQTRDRKRESQRNDATQVLRSGIDRTANQKLTTAAKRNRHTVGSTAAYVNDSVRMAGIEDCQDESESSESREDPNESVSSVKKPHEIDRVASNQDLDGGDHCLKDGEMKSSACNVGASAASLPLSNVKGHCERRNFEAGMSCNDDSDATDNTLRQGTGFSIVDDSPWHKLVARRKRGQMGVTIPNLAIGDLTVGKDASTIQAFISTSNRDAATTDDYIDPAHSTASLRRSSSQEASNPDMRHDVYHRRPSIEDPTTPEIERIARSWQALVQVAESCREVGSEISDSAWQAKRNENMALRLCFLRRQRNPSSSHPARKLASSSLVDELLGGRREEEHQCLRCMGGYRAGRICSCIPDPWQPPLHSNHSSGSGGARQTPSQEKPNEGIKAPPGLEVTPWNRLLRNPVPDSFDSKTQAQRASYRRSKKAAWRQWWASHKAGESGGFQDRGGMYFAPTPTSTYPGTPREESGDSYYDNGQHKFNFPPSGGSNSSPMELASPFVYLPVPLHLAPQVRQYIQSLLVAGGGAAGLPPKTFEV